ncbi:MAG: ATP-binding protein [Pseudobdellovibrionaceae bacterium]
MHFIRYLSKQVKHDIKDRMIFIGGPRQVGKTTFAKSFLTSNSAYLSWDDLKDRRIIQKHELDTSLSIIALDEIHKYARWRALLKGIYDKHKNHLKIIVTGSARLDYFRKGGDSLFGRYHYFRMHPLTASEVAQGKKPSEKDVLDLLQFGGFPEPFLKKDEAFLRRWQNERNDRIFHSDLRDLVTLKDYSSIELLNSMLPERVGSLLSRTSLAEDLEKSPHTIDSWLTLLENIYSCFRVSPFGSPKVKAIKKQQKLYLWDWSIIENKGPRFENMVASHLLKYCHFLEDTQGYKMELRYLRDIQGHEIDFVVIKNKSPLFAVECKTGDKAVSSHIEYFKSRTKIPKYYQVHLGRKTFGTPETGKVLPFWDFCTEVDLI